ncbi:MAG: Asp-tRNA(Asn)/Glu-tRNA(Gln) amidotransferase subunit GatC [Phycisphaerales bacterium]|nr:MAG: Asp-tRNA(Asn)/Glu-tRNA(Gln) amidotransferase subunit GatC [Phycisphaerales bacterium]
MGTPLDETVIRHVALLSRLKITDEEVKVYAKQLSQVVDYMALLNEVDTADVPPAAYALQISNVFREDDVRGAMTSEQALSNAPGQENGFFSVPKVIDRKSV